VSFTFCVVTDADFQIQVNIDLDVIDGDSQCQYKFDTTHKLKHLYQPVSSVWLAQPPISHLHIYVWPRSCVGQWNLHVHSGDVIIIFSFCLAIPLQLAEQFHQVGKQFHQVIWGRDFGEMLMEVPNCEGLRYIPETQVNELGLQDLGYNEKALLICHRYISAFDHLTSISLNDRSGGVVVTGQPGIGANSLLFMITLLTSVSNPTKANPALFFIFFSAVYVKVCLPP